MLYHQTVNVEVFCNLVDCVDSVVEIAPETCQYKDDVEVKLWNLNQSGVIVQWEDKDRNQHGD